MFADFVSTKKYIQDNQVKMVDLKFTDLWGRWHHVTIPASAFTPDIMSEGVGFDGSSVGLKSVKSGDMSLIPELSTGFLDPFTEASTLSFLCNTVEADTKSIFRRDPRQIAKNAERFLAESGIASSSSWGPEFEFYIFSSASFNNAINDVNYHFESEEAFWNSASYSSGDFIPKHGGYHAIPPRDKHFNLRTQVVLALEQAGVAVKYHHHEVGGPGQCEIETPMLGLPQAADASMLIKYFVKMTCAQAGQTATFLPKPLYGEAGSGMHFHQQLFRDATNLFYDPSSPNLMSKTALYYIGGLLKHAPSVMAFTNPTSNSYRRLVPGYEAPVNSFFSTGNRSAAIRIPKYATKPEMVRFEFRPPDATCNPYLAISAMLLAGIDGIQREIDPTVEGFGPIDENIFSWSPERRKSIKSLPTSLEEALHALQQDNEYLTAAGIFDDDLISDWILAKEKELADLRGRPHPYEIETYFDF